MSAEITESDIDLQMINGESSAATSSQLPFAAELMDYASAIASRDEQALTTTRDKLLAAAGAEMTVDAACVAANFQRMVRIADTTRIPTDETRRELMAQTQETLQLRRFGSSENTPESSG